MKRWRVILLVVGVTSLVVVAAWCWQQREPVYLGKPITYWIEPWQHHNTEPRARVDAAFAEMDDRAVRWLVRQLDWKPSGFVKLVNSVTRKMSIVFPDSPDRRERAAIALGKLGPRAAAATNALERLESLGSEPRWAASRNAAAAALLHIRDVPLPTVLNEVIGSATSEKLIFFYWALITDDAGERLIAILDSTKDPVLRANVVVALGLVFRNPDTSIAALSRQLETSDSDLTLKALGSLAAFGTNASAASPAVVKLLSGPNQWVAARASNVLAVIDPEAAKRYGIRKQEP